MTRSPSSCTAEVHVSRRQWKKQVDSGASFCGFACAAYQRRQVLTTCGYSRREESVINSSETERFIQKNNPNSKKKKSLSRTNKNTKPKEPSRKTSCEKAAETRKTTSGNGHKDKLLQGKRRAYCSLTRTAAADTPIQQLPQNTAFTRTSPLRTELCPSTGAQIKGVGICNTGLRRTKEVFMMLSISILQIEMRRKLSQGRNKIHLQNRDLHIIFLGFFFFFFPLYVLLYYIPVCMF